MQGFSHLVFFLLKTDLLFTLKKKNVVTFKLEYNIKGNKHGKKEELKVCSAG